MDILSSGRRRCSALDPKVAAVSRKPSILECRRTWMNNGVDCVSTEGGGGPHVPQCHRHDEEPTSQ